ncbi:MAG: carbon storage regulator [Planctomycetota bacterium]
MLILARKRNESVVIKAGEHVIKIELLDIRGSNVRIGFTVPHEVVIHREEVWEAIQSGRMRPKDAPSEDDEWQAWAEKGA